MKSLKLLLAFVLMGSVTFAQDTSEFLDKTDEFFGEHVRQGEIDYKSIHANPEALDHLMTMAKTVSVYKEDAKTYQSFWINAYNLAVVKGIIDNYPIKSPMDKGGFFDKTKYELGGKKITLNDIENNLLRAQFNDARVHFVLVCGAKGCPPIIDEAYRPETLESQLQTQTMKALNNPDFIQVEDNKVKLSEIFKWYKKDFVQNGNEIEYINQFRSDKIPTDAKIGYYTYDWRLNAQ